MGSIKDVAARARVAVGTVSNVLNRPERVSETTRARVQAAIDALGFVRSESARDLRTGRSRTIGLIVFDVMNPFFTSLARGVEDAAREAGLATIICNSDERIEKEHAYLSLLEARRVLGVLVVPLHEPTGHYERLRRAGIPFVSVDRELPTDCACSVSVDDIAGGAAAVRHLLELDHPLIAYVSGPLHLEQCRQRLKGARAAAAEAGAGHNSLRLLEADALTVAAGRDAGERLLGLSPRPSAVFCANDLLALGVLQVVTSHGLHVPDDIAVVGYDDIDFAAAAAVPLTSVRQPSRRMGELAVELLLAEDAGRNKRHTHQRVVFEPELIVRESTVGHRRSKRVRPWTPPLPRRSRMH